jgi:hypothetical protein
MHATTKPKNNLQIIQEIGTNISLWKMVTYWGPRLLTIFGYKKAIIKLRILGFFQV